MIEFDPMSGLLPQGEYDFYIKAATEKKTRFGDDMLMIALCIHDKSGKEHELRDFFVIMPNWMWKLERFCSSIGMIEQFKSGKLDCLEMVNKSGVLETKQEIDENYGAQNKVSKYLKKTNKEDSSNTTEIEDDDLPF